MDSNTKLAADLQPAVAVALAKAIGKATDDVALAPGLYTVDEVLTLRIVGTVERRPDNEFTPPVKVPAAELLAAALEIAGVDRRKAKRALEQAAVKVMVEGQKRAENDDRLRDAAGAIEMATEQVKAATPKQPKAGATTVKARVELLDAQIAAA